MNLHLLLILFKQSFLRFYLYFILATKRSFNLKNFSIKKIKKLLIRYQNFPKYGLTAGLVGNAAFEILHY